ncbi:hypothetical protein TSOC_008603 [Tetrabaena socialis]|uniref:Integrase catalytic domain-containing protein n=1 Tax=Tetrabaena socialis TaxID=47790 RepID=A0A2J7ZY21_9CHLO|nr:hypothetical protein TSOC_008603 [Tetrabaena socialis]|eukprot:PNH05169.1 hypothetical protein TSOC_008603 [Tetrabaena socialis]
MSDSEKTINPSAAPMAEAVTDNGTEPAAESAELLERCFIDHCTTSAGHPQADGTAERIVKVLNEALRKASARYSPYQLLYGSVVRGHGPPGAVRECFEQPLHFEGPRTDSHRLAAAAR